MILGATLVMLLLLPRFHLSLDLPAARRSTSSGQPTPMRSLAVRSARVPLVLLAGVTVAAMFANANMSRYELLSFGLGPSRLSPSSLASAPVAGWTLRAWPGCGANGPLAPPPSRQLACPALGR